MDVCRCATSPPQYMGRRRDFRSACRNGSCRSAIAHVRHQPLRGPYTHCSVRRHAHIFRWCRARRLAGALAGLFALSSVLLATGPERAAAVSTLVVPFHPQATVRLEGAGWGHGVGMSQWGARGRAHAGQSATEIIQAYYQGAPKSARPIPAAR